MQPKNVRSFVITTIILLYLTTSIISLLHTIEFFELSNPYWLAVSLSIAFEIGAAAALASLIVLEKINKSLTWLLFILLTAIQINGNLFYAYRHLNDYQGWVELFGLVDSDVIGQKRMLAIISGAILPLVSLGFIKSLVDYMKPKEEPVIADVLPQEAEENMPIVTEDVVMNDEPEVTADKEIISDVVEKTLLDKIKVFRKNDI